MEAVIHDYFQNIFKSSVPSVAYFCAVTSCMDVKVSPAMNHVLDYKISALEVRTALKQMHSSKAPESMMAKLSFSNLWIRKIMHCISSVSYLYLINGEVRGFLKPSKWLRQGDHLSPYLFLLCAEGFSSLLSAAERSHVIRGISCWRGDPSVSHLFFVDDSLLFVRAENSTLASSSSSASFWIPSASTLLRRHIAGNDFCLRCSSGFESLVHAYWGYPRLHHV
ncbi:hypothetical protein ACOSQ3_000758 [Xanthoceras sorbifolium]